MSTVARSTLLPAYRLSSSLLKCHDSSRVSAMPTNRAYGTCYAIATNMLTHGLHGPHAVIIMDLDVHGHALYKYRHDTLQPPMVA